MTVILIAVLVLAIVGLAGALVVVARRPPLDPVAVVDQLARTNQALMDRGAAELGGKTAIIDRQLQAMNGELERMTNLVREFERDRDEKFGTLGAQLAQQQKGMTDLMDTTHSLREALSSSKSRGQWGERMAEDVLRLAGLVEGVNYRKQRAIEGGMPDFTFFLPNDLLLHMDVKFPLDNYVRCLEAESEIEEKRYRDGFLRDVRGHVRALASRTYVDPSGGTVDFVLFFIPNEQLYGFIHEHDTAIADEAARQGVILCSPLTLFAVLALVRQTVDNFQLARTSNEILALLGTFKKQWSMFVDQMDKVGRGIKSVSGAFEELDGTRRRQLERQFDKIDDLRHQEQLSVVEDGHEDGGRFALDA